MASCTHKQGGFPALLLVGGDGLDTLRKSCSKDEASGVVVESLCSSLLSRSAGRMWESQRGERPQGQTTDASGHGFSSYKYKSKQAARRAGHPRLDSAAMSCAKDFCRIHVVALPVGANAGSSVLEVNLVSGFEQDEFFSSKNQSSRRW